MQTLTDVIPPILLADLAFLRALISLGSILFLLRHFLSRPAPTHHASANRPPRNPAQRFLPCHRVSIIFPA